MFEIRNKEIRITKGDSASINVNLGSYTMQQGDVLTFTAKNETTSAIIFQVTSTTNVIELTPDETKKLEVGKCCFEIKITTSSGAFTMVGLTDTVVFNMIVYPSLTE